MSKKPVFVAALALGAWWILTAQPPPSPGIFTAEQARAGRVVYERTCGQCHTQTLMGRKGGGDNGELPPLNSLSDSNQKFVIPSGRVPPLAGQSFLNSYGAKTVAQLIARFQETVDDPYLALEGVDDAFTVNLTAYVLQVNGAKPGTKPLTRETQTSVNEAVR